MVQKLKINENTEIGANSSIKKIISYYHKSDIIAAARILKNISEAKSKLDSRFELDRSPNSPRFMDGTFPHEYYFKTFDTDNGYAIGIGGDVNDEFNNIAIVYVADDINGEYMIAEFNYLEDFDGAVNLANKLANEISPEMSWEEAKEICVKNGLESELDA